MKILAAGDIHGDTNLARELATKADKEKVDLVILCGESNWAEKFERLCREHKSCNLEIIKHAVKNS